MKRWKTDLTPISEKRIKVQKIKPSLSGVCWTSKNGIRDEISSAQHVFKKTLNKNQNFPNALLGWHRKCQSFQRWHIQKKTFWGNSSPCYCYTTNLCQPVLNQSPKYTPLNFTSLGLRLSSHTSLFWTLPGLLSMLHHAPVPTHPEPTF